MNILRSLPTWATSGILFAPTFIVFLGLGGCGYKKPGTEYSFTRTVQEPTVLRTCLGSTQTNCYALRWRYPMDTRNLVRFHIWIDTLVLAFDAQNVENRHKQNSLQVSFAQMDGVELDSIDLSAELAPYLERDSVLIAIWAEYSDDGISGSIQRLSAFFGDNIAPVSPRWSVEVGPDSLALQWMRPNDQRDFYQPEISNGPIAGYNLELLVERGGAQYNRADFQMRLYRNGQLETGKLRPWTRLRRAVNGVELDSLITDTAGTRLLLAVVDGQGFMADSLAANTFTLVLKGLAPESRHQIRLFAYDSAGNFVQGEGVVGGLVSLTDSIRPLMPTRFWVAQDTVAGGGFQLDSNRLVLYWPMAVDPLRLTHGIRLDSQLHIPTACGQNSCWRMVESYQVETGVRGVWNPAPRAGGVISERYNQRYRIVDGRPQADSSGNYHVDTLRWVAPGDTLKVRVRAIDASGFASPWLIDTLRISAGVLAHLQCPPGYVGVQRRLGGDTTNLPRQFCAGRYEQSDSQGQLIQRVTWAQAREFCRGLSHEGFRFDLCGEDDWLSACLSRTGVDFGVIQEPPFYAQEFLFQHCNVATGDTIGLSIPRRSLRCVSPDGVHDLPGHLQEWVWALRARRDSVSGDTLSIDTIPLLKGSSYKIFETADWTRLARCNSRGFPFRQRPGFTRDTVLLYRNGSRLDTLFVRDTVRAVFGSIAPSAFTDTLQFFDVRLQAGGPVLGEDIVDLREYRRRGGEAWLSVLAEGLHYTPTRQEIVFLRGTQRWEGSEFFFRDASVGMRCCSYPINP